MAKFTLIQVSSTNQNRTINGSILQGHIGTLETATAKARSTEKANSNRIDIAVVDEIYTTLNWGSFSNLKRLDIREYMLIMVGRTDELGYLYDIHHMSDFEHPLHENATYDFSMKFLEGKEYTTAG